MKNSRWGALCLAAAWLAACATAEDGGVPAQPGGSTGSSGSSNSSRGGAPAAGGTSAFGGSGATPGGSGTPGAAGLSNGGASGTAAASGGSSGALGGGGNGGSVPVFETGVCAQNPTMSLSYETSSTGSQISGQYQFINTSDTPIPVAALKIRYFFSNEKTSGWNPNIYDTRLGGGTGGDRDLKANATLTVVDLGARLNGADTYAELTYTGSATLEKTATGTADWGLQPKSNDLPDQVQADDYSFNAAATSFTVWDHVAIYEGDTLVWGCVPMSSEGGGAGAGQGGDTSAGGNTGTGSAGEPGAAGAP